MTDQTYITWPLSRIDDAIIMLEARRANFQADAKHYRMRCEQEDVPPDDGVAYLTDDIVDIIDGQLATLRDAREQVAWREEQAS